MCIQNHWFCWEPGRELANLANWCDSVQLLNSTSSCLQGKRVYSNLNTLHGKSQPVTLRKVGLGAVDKSNTSWLENFGVQVFRGLDFLRPCMWTGFPTPHFTTFCLQKWLIFLFASLWRPYRHLKLWKKWKHARPGHKKSRPQVGRTHLCKKMLLVWESTWNVHPRTLNDVAPKQIRGQLNNVTESNHNDSGSYDTWTDLPVPNSK